VLAALVAIDDMESYLSCRELSLYVCLSSKGVGIIECLEMLGV
jgi:hypothetical protein